MKKRAEYFVITILLLTIIILSGTYAFYSTSINTSNFVVTNSSPFEVIYSGGTTINGDIQMVTTKEEGYNTTVNIRTSDDSYKMRANLYLNIEEIDRLNVAGLKWEVYGYKNSTLVYTNNGTFANKANGDIITIVNNYLLSDENTGFIVYIWLDGNDATVGNNVTGGSFSGYIGANTETVTANLS